MDEMVPARNKAKTSEAAVVPPSDLEPEPSSHEPEPTIKKAQSNASAGTPSVDEHEDDDDGSLFGSDKDEPAELTAKADATAAKAVGGRPSANGPASASQPSTTRDRTRAKVQTWKAPPRVQMMDDPANLVIFRKRKMPSPPPHPPAAPVQPGQQARFNLPATASRPPPPEISNPAPTHHPHRWVPPALAHAQQLHQSTVGQSGRTSSTGPGASATSRAAQPVQKATDPRRRSPVAILSGPSSPPAPPSVATASSTLTSAAPLRPQPSLGSPPNASALDAPACMTGKAKKGDSSAFLPVELNSVWLDQSQSLPSRRVAILQAGNGPADKSTATAIRKRLRARGWIAVDLAPVDTPPHKVDHPDVVIGPSAFMIDNWRQLPWVVDMRAAGTRFCLYDDPPSSKPKPVVELGAKNGVLITFSPRLLEREAELLEMLQTNLLDDLSRLSQEYSLRILPQVIAHLTAQAGTSRADRTPRQSAIYYFLRRTLSPPVRVLPDWTPPPLDLSATDHPPDILKQHQAKFSLELQLKSALCTTVEHVLDICTAVSHPVIAADDLEQATVTDLIRKQEDLEVAKDYRRFILVTNEVLPEQIDVAGIELMTVEDLHEEVGLALEAMAV